MANRSLSSAKVGAKINATVQNVMDDGNTASGAVNINVDDTVSDGVSAGEANRGWQWVHTAANPKQITSGSTLVFDLYDFAALDMGAGDTRDIVGQTITLEEIVAILVKNSNAEGAAGQLEVEPDAVNGWTPIGSHTVATGGALRAQGLLLKYQPAEAGFDVADGSNHRLLLTANGGNVNVEIAVLGRHDDNESSSSSSSSSSSVSSSSSSSSSSVSSSSSSSPSSSSASSSSLSSSSSASSSSASSASSLSSSSVSSVSSESSSST